VAERAARIEGELAEKGIPIAIQDPLLGATALSIGLAVATLNLRHFQLPPGFIGSHNLDVDSFFTIT
jgi:predicted nucleic acid-binding protein